MSLRTIDEAEQAGWTHLQVRCPSCRMVVQMPWRLLRQATAERDLEKIAVKMRCRKCGTPSERADLVTLRASQPYAVPQEVTERIWPRPET